MPFVSDTALNKYAIDTTQYANAAKQMVGFMRGKRILVTYYRLLNREGTNNRTNIADLTTARNVIDTEYQKILNLEITLPKGFDFTANNTQANMSITGSAMMYPGMNPNVGDIFLTGVGDGRIGVCRISSVTPMTWRTDRIYTVNFLVQEFVEPSNQDPIEGSVTITSVFSKENYLGGTASLLSENTYLQLGKIKELRSNLCRFYHQSFYDSNLGSYVRPDGIYDPWVVQFMTHKVTLDDVNIRAKNLLGNDSSSYQKTLWGRLEDRYNTTFYGVFAYANIVAYRQTRLNVFLTELYGHSVLMPCDDPESGESYLYSANLYNNVTSAMTAEEALVYNAITQRSVGDLTVLITTYFDTVFSLTPDKQFYKIPLYLHLIDMALQSQYREIDAPSMNYASTGDEG